MDQIELFSLEGFEARRKAFIYRSKWQTIALGICHHGDDVHHRH